MINKTPGEIAEVQYAIATDEHLYDVTPNPRYLESLRDTGYDNYQAIADIVDNSVDAIVSMDSNPNPFIKILTKFSDKGKGRILIIDNGSGMVKETLIEALKLGSETHKERETELGFFGVGLNAATVSMGRGFKVITKHADDTYLTGIFDLDRAIKEESWKFVSIEESDDDDIKSFVKLTNDAPTGTIIEIYSLDRISNHQKSQFDEILLKTIGRVYRYFISENSNGNNSDGKIAFYLNDKRIRKIDQMGRELKGTKLLNENQPEQKYQFNIDGELIEVIVKYYYVDSEIETVYPSEKLNGRSNGFYVMRNERQIMEAERLDFSGIDKSSGHHTNFRAEILFDGKFDHIFKTNVMKNRIIMPQQLTDKMQSDVSNYVKYAKEEREKNAPINEDVDENVKKDVESIVNSKNKSLSTPTLLRDKKGNLIKKEEVITDAPEENDVKRDRKKEENPRKPKTKYKIDVDFVHNGESGSFYVPRHMGGGKYLLRINLDHGFYTEFEKLNRQGREFIINLLHSYALAAHSEIYSEDLDTIDELINTWSNFLRRDLKNN
jgi:hypothetical protein